MKIIVTGATGVIGKALIQEMKRRGQDVRGLVRKSGKVDFLNAQNIPLVYGDLNDFDSLVEAFKGQDIVIHTAGLVTDWGKTADFIKTNFEGTRNVLEACISAKVKRLIYFSTVDVFGAENNVTYNEISPLQQLPGGYDLSKVMAEKLVRSYIQNRKLAISIVYPSWVYGEGDSHFVPEIVKAIQDGSMFFFRNGGRHVVEINYIENLVEAVMVILDHDQTIGEGYILSDEPKITFRELVNRIAQELGHGEIKLTAPYLVTYFAAWVMEGIFRLLHSQNRPLLTRQAVMLLGNNIVYDTSKLRALGFKEKVDFDTAIKKAVEKVTA